jgi:L-ascorbate metabolism protein UlaG (beta-lactamase superfamily)
MAAPRLPHGGAGGTTVTYLGHATVLVESAEGTLLTDPVFSERIGRIFTKRTTPSTAVPEAMPPLSAVLISHAHHDHLDYRSLRRLRPPPPMVVPWGLSLPMRWHGFEKTRVLRAWESTTIGGWTIVAVPSRHFGGRLPLVGTSGHVGYVLSGPSCLYFAGDTGLDEALFREVGRRFDIDLAILPIAGAVFPWFRSNHMNALDALQALDWLGARRMLPMHYATFPLSFESAGEPLRRLTEESLRSGVADRVHVLQDGACLHLASSGPRDVEGLRLSPETADGRAA